MIQLLLSCLTASGLPPRLPGCASNMPTTASNLPLPIISSNTDFDRWLQPLWGEMGDRRKKQEIREAFSHVIPGEQEEFSGVVAPLLRQIREERGDYWNSQPIPSIKAKVIAIFRDIPNTERKSVVDLVTPLCKSLTWAPQLKLIQVLSTCPTAEREEFSKALIKLSNQAHKDHKDGILTVICNFLPIERLVFTQSLLSIFLKINGEYKTKKLAESLIQIPHPERQSLCELIIPFLKNVPINDRDGYGKKYEIAIINSLRKVPSNERATLCDLLKSLIPKIDYADRSAIISTLHGVPSDKREVLCDFLRAIPSVSNYVVHIFKDVPNEERKPLYNLIKPLLKKEEYYNLSPLVETLRTLPINQRKSFVKHVESLDDCASEAIIKFMGTLPQVEQETFTSCITAIQCPDVIKVIQKIPATDRPIFCKAIIQLMDKDRDVRSYHDMCSKYRLQLVEALSELPVAEIEQISTALGPILQTMTGKYRKDGQKTFYGVAFIEVLKRIPDDRRGKLLLHLDSLCQKPDRDARSISGGCWGDETRQKTNLEIIEAFNNLTEAEQEEFSRLCLTVFNQALLHDKVNVITFFKDMPSYKREKFFTLMANLFNQIPYRESQYVERYKGITDLIECMETVNSVPIDERQKLCKLVRPLLIDTHDHIHSTKNHQRGDKKCTNAHVISLCSQIPPKERAACVDLIVPIINRVEEAWSKIPILENLIDAFKIIPFDEQQEFCHTVNVLFITGNAQIIPSLAKISIIGRSHIDQLITQMIDGVETSSGKIILIDALIKALSILPQQERGKFCDFIKPLLITFNNEDEHGHEDRYSYNGKHYEHTNAHIISLFARLSAEERERLDQLMPLIHDVKERGEILETLSTLSYNEREEFCSSLKPLLLHDTFLQREANAHTISLFAQIPDAERQDFSRLVLPLIRDMDSGRATVLDAFKSVANNERETFCLWVSSILDENNGYNYKADLIACLAGIQDNERENFAQSFLPLIEGSRAHIKRKIIKTFKTVPAENRVFFLNFFRDNNLSQQIEEMTVEVLENLARAGRDNWQVMWDTMRAPRQTVQLRPGIAFQVHNYAATSVTDANSSNRPMSLLDAVKVRILQDIRALNLVASSYSVTWEELKKLCSQDDQRLLLQGLSNRSDQDTLCQIWAWVKRYERTELWLKQWLLESRNAYGNNGESCQKGVTERMTTAVRGISAVVDTLFAKPEGEFYIKTTLAELTPDPSQPEKRKNLIQRLADLGAKNLEDAKKFLKDWLDQQINDHNQENSFQGQSQTLAESLDYLPPDEQEKLMAAVNQKIMNKGENSTG